MCRREGEQGVKEEERRGRRDLISQSTKSVKKSLTNMCD